VIPFIRLPAVTEDGLPAIVKWSKVAGATLKRLLVPASPAPDVLIVIPEPVVVMVMGNVITPLEKGPIVVGLIVPVESVIAFDPV
jgi:hypothetical protein